MEQVWFNTALWLGHCVDSHAALHPAPDVVGAFRVVVGTIALPNPRRGSRLRDF